MVEQYRKTAYHESGHVAMAYISDYHCKEVEILVSGDGKTTTEYGDDELLIAAITNCKQFPELFDQLPATIKSKTLDVAFKASMILLAGGVAESIHSNAGMDEENLPLEFSGPDIIRFQNIDYLLKQNFKKHPTDFLEQIAMKINDIFANPEIWDSISALAESIVSQKRMKLTRVEIEDILTKTKFFDNI